MRPLQGSLCQDWLRGTQSCQLWPMWGQRPHGNPASLRVRDLCPAVSSHLKTALITVGLSLPASREPLSDKPLKEFLTSSAVARHALPPDIGPFVAET